MLLLLMILMNWVYLCVCGFISIHIFCDCKRHHIKMSVVSAKLYQIDVNLYNNVMFVYAIFVSECFHYQIVRVSILKQTLSDKYFSRWQVFVIKRQRPLRHVRHFCFTKPVVFCNCVSILTVSNTGTQLIFTKYFVYLNYCYQYVSLKRSTTFITTPQIKAPTCHFYTNH